MNRIIVVVDLGHFKAYRETKGAVERVKLELIESYDNIEAHGKLGDKLTDKAGKFAMAGGSKQAGGYGEPHNLNIEIKKRLIKTIAKEISDLVQRESCKSWNLAAAKEINNQIVEYLEPAVRSKLGQNVTADLTKVKTSEILDHFE
ncbi:MAG TPA: host attachment protein [Thermodesulfovibrionia bacterium]|nr:host attachment protein [Thermodesulfovibrionia bacterium]